MPSAFTFILAGLAVYAFTFGLIHIALSTKQFKQQPQKDQERARKQFRWALILLPLFFAGTYLLLLAPPGVIRLLPVTLYLLLWLFVFWLLWRGYRLGIKREARLVKSMNGKPMRNAETLVVPFAIANLLLAVSCAAILIAIPLLGVQFKAWAPLFTVISGLYTLFAWHHERKNAA